MTPETKTPRFRILPASGTLLVSTDLHGNGGDFRMLRGIFLDTLARDKDAQWVLLGDIVHGPNPEVRVRKPDLYDYDDESWPIAEGVLALQQSHPGCVHFVLGNHDHAHIGRPRTRKFYPGEAAHLEGGLDEAQREALHRLFRKALLAVVAPCGLLLAHGSPDDTLRRLEDLGGIRLPPGPEDGYGAAVLDSFLNSYGQPAEVMGRLLRAVSQGGPEVHLVVHGHDKDEAGYFTEGGNQVCPVLFGAPRQNKRYLLLDLASSYRRAEDLREGIEIRRLYGA